MMTLTSSTSQNALTSGWLQLVAVNGDHQAASNLVFNWSSTLNAELEIL